MSQKTIECSTCGAVLAAEDLFCGECGQLVPAAPGSPPTPAEAPPQPAPPPAADRPAPLTGWIVGATVAAVLGVLLCLAGAGLWALLAFTAPTEGMSQAENFQAAVCCGSFLVGPALLLLAAAAVIWTTRLRKRA